LKYCTASDPADYAPNDNPSGEFHFSLSGSFFLPMYDLNMNFSTKNTIKQRPANPNQ
jgi:hypothetical protein